jgi:hypothetical protein
MGENKCKECLHFEAVDTCWRWRDCYGDDFKSYAEDVMNILRLRNIELQASIKELEAERRWIPVSERLPGDDEQVYGYCVDNEYEPYSLGTFYVNREGNSVLDDGEYQNHITHWMPLPEPPEANNVRA